MKTYSPSRHRRLFASGPFVAQRSSGRLRAITLLLLLLSATVSERATAEMTDRQAALLTNNCVQCHARPGIGVPMMGDPAAWKERAATGEDAMLRNVVLGLRGMPPLGYCSACSEQDFRVMIRMMANLPESPK